LHAFALLVTEWRRTPTHQGGYILDGGVHHMAGLRLLLDSHPGNEIAKVSAFTNQLQEYLPPVDTADVILRTKSGVTGVFQISRGTTLRANDWTIACEKGWIQIQEDKVTISRDGQEEVKTIPNERTGVPPEIRAWGEGLVSGTVRPEQEPEAALADLELVSFQHTRNMEKPCYVILTENLLDRTHSTQRRTRRDTSTLQASDGGAGEMMET
jgi:predicted dehydrogenase